MDKEIVLSVINALKTLKDIFFRQNELILQSLILQNDIEMKRLIYQHKRFKKITNDIDFLMEKVLFQDEFEKYLSKSNRIIRRLLKEEKKNNELVKKIYEESLLMHKDLQEKLLDFDYILDEIVNSLK